MATNKNIVDGFPALRKLGFATGKRAVPFVQQLEWTDCGAASLCMVMAYYGRETKLAEVRDAWSRTPGGGHPATRWGRSSRARR